MDKDFFGAFEQRRSAFAERAGYELAEVRAQVILGNGRTYIVDAVVEAADSWVQLDVRDVDTEEQLRSLMLPYYQITHVLFIKHRARVAQAGFAG